MIDEICVSTHVQCLCNSVAAHPLVRRTHRAIHSLASRAEGSEINRTPVSRFPPLLLDPKIEETTGMATNTGVVFAEVYWHS